MNGPTLEDLQAQLPAGWKLRTKIKRGEQWIESGPYRHTARFVETMQLQAESDRHNVILEGGWAWILQRVTSYTLSPKQAAP